MYKCVTTRIDSSLLSDLFKSDFFLLEETRDIELFVALGDYYINKIIVNISKKKY
jgi:hypothetical protein